MCGGGTCQSTGFSRMQTQSSCSMPFTVQAGSHQIGTAIVVVTLPLLSAVAKRSLQSNSARFINSSSPANARRLQGHCEACQCTAVSRWVGDYIVSNGRFFFFPCPSHREACSHGQPELRATRSIKKMYWAHAHFFPR